MRLFILVFIFSSSVFANLLQDVIDNAQENSTIKLSTGIYVGNIIIDKPLTIIAKNKNVIIKGDGFGSVVTIKSSYVTLKNLTITNSGNKMYKIDSAISMKNVSNCEINRCKILDSLYGIDMQMVNKSKILNNYITSKKLDISLRGNALKLYYSNNNLINNNTIEYSRDITLNYSNNNVFDKNTFIHNRFATHISLSHNNTIKNSLYKYNSVSIMVMGAKNMKVVGNIIESSNGAAGIGIVIKGVSNFKFEKNIVKYNAKGIYIDGGEKAKGMKRHINFNEISYNGEAIHFHASIKDNNITHNNIYGNIDDVVKDIEGRFSDSNIVEYNYWDRYTGFDENNDNIGDNSHQIYQYADQLWHYNNKVKFFYASPVMSLLNFIANLAPFVEPNLLLEDLKPYMTLDDSQLL